MRRQVPTILACLFMMVGVLAPSRSQAAIVPGILTLADLMNLGSTGVTVDDVRYYGFQYTGSGRNVPTASQILVDAPVGGLGLVFRSTWKVNGGAAMNSTVRYAVSAGPTLNNFAGITISFDGAVPARITPSQATLTEVLTTGGRSLATLRLATDRTGAAPDTLSRSYAFASPTTDLAIVQMLGLRSAGATTDDQAVSAETISTLFLSVHLPEPSAMMVMGTLGLATLLRRNR